MGIEHRTARSPRFARHRRAAGVRSFRPRLETLESRCLLANLGLDIQLLREDFTPLSGVDELVHGGEALKVGDVFWVQILAWDERGVESGGVISLPLHIAWDPSVIDYTGDIPAPAVPPADRDVPLNSLLLTPDFPNQRLLTDFVEEVAADHDPEQLDGFPDPVPVNYNVLGLRGAAVPAIGSGSAIGTALPPSGNVDQPTFFSRLRFQAVAATDMTPFVMQLAGSMSFQDAAALDDIVHVVDGGNRQTADEENRVAEFIAITEVPPLSSIAGCVFLDTNPTDGMLNRVNGVPVEFGVPGVAITLEGTTLTGASVSLMTTTGPDGSYRFDNLEPGTYRVIETQPPFPQFIDLDTVVVGTIDGVPVGTAGSDEIRDIVLPEGTEGVDYCFAEIAVPDKRLFLASTDVRMLVAGQMRIPAQTIEGTSADDRILVAAGDDRWNVTVENSTQTRQFSLPLEEARILYVDAVEGRDTVQFVGTAHDEVAQLAPGGETLRRGTDYNAASYAAMAIAAEDVTVDGNGGDDFAVFYDSPGNDQLVASGNSAALTWADGRMAEAIDFDEVRAVSLERPNQPENDTLDSAMIDFVLSTIGSWTLI